MGHFFDIRRLIVVVIDPSVNGVAYLANSYCGISVSFEVVNEGLGSFHFLFTSSFLVKCTVADVDFF